MKELIFNAMNFTADKVQSLIEINATEDGKGNWLFSVKDNGIGIKKENFLEWLI